MSALPAHIDGAMRLRLAEISEYFTDDCKLTMIVRKPGNSECDVVCTDDEFDELIALLERRKRASK